MLRACTFDGSKRDPDGSAEALVGSRSVLALGLFFGPILAPAGVAQEEKAAAAPTVESPALALQAPDADVMQGPLGLILVDEVQLQVWPSENSPRYEDVLRKDDVVRIGETRDGFVCIQLPTGPAGFVHKDFATDPVDARVSTKGKRVSFRYRPKSGEAPVDMLPEGTDLWVLGEPEGAAKWWRVRQPSRECWLPQSAVQVFEDPPLTMRKSHVDFVRVRNAEVQGYAQAQRDAVAARQLLEEQRAKVSTLLATYQQELDKATQQQQLDPIAQQAESLLAEVGDESALASTLRDLRRRIDQQRWVVEAVSVRDAQPVPAQVESAEVSPVVKDPLERFQAVGFLRWENGLLGPGRFVIEKGGQPLYLVSCDSNRYELSLFVDHEVGLIGSRRRPATESLRILDVEKIEVLTPAR